MSRRRFALDSAVLPNPGDFAYRLRSPEAAREWWLSGPVESHIGHSETAEALARVLDVPAPPVDRRTVRLAPGDEALVFRIALPPHARRLTVKAEGREDVERLIAECEIGLLWRLR